MLNFTFSAPGNPQARCSSRMGRSSRGGHHNRLAGCRNRLNTKAMNTERPPAPWYESGLFWGLTGVAIAFVLAALTDHHLRWLLWVAWPCITLLAFWLAKRTRKFWAIAVLGSALGSASLLWLYHRLKPPPGVVIMTFKPEQIGPPAKTKSSPDPASQ
jgi:hypothetical protein